MKCGFSGTSLARFFVEHYTEVNDPVSTVDNRRAIMEEEA
jgi:hypothetical protein